MRSEPPSSAPPAVEAVAARARSARAEAVRRVERWLAPHVPGLDDARIEQLAARVPTAGRLTINFHPDRPTHTARSVAAGLRATGRYVSQFLTGASNGSRSAVRGGERDEWERRLFDGAYDAVDALDARPVYGALDLLHDPHGGSPRFGSCFLVLRAPVLPRVTFCVGDSHTGPVDVGTAAEPMSLLAGLAEQAAPGALLDRSLGVRALLELLADDVLDEAHPRSPARVLDGYVEAQIHGGVDLHAEVERLVVDPSFAGTEVADDLAAAARIHGFELSWHAGSELAVDEVPADLRGPTMPALARRVAGDATVIDAAAIGRAAVTVALPHPLVTGDAPESELQQLKYLWHVLLTRGHDQQVAERG